MQSVGVGPGYLFRVHRIEEMPLRLLPCEYIPTLLSALVALELGDRKDHKRDRLKEKRDRANGVLATILDRWKPDGRGIVRLPPLVLSHPADASAGTPPSLSMVKGLERAPPEYLAIQCRRHEFKVGRDYRRAWSKAKNPKLDECVLFLLRIPTDDLSCFAFPAATLRWALDLAAALAASQALAMCDLRAERGPIDKDTRRSVEMFTPLWRALWGASSSQLDAIPIVPAFFDNIFPSSPDHQPGLGEALRTQASMLTLTSGGLFSELLMRHFGLAPTEFHKAWDSGLKSISVPALPSAGGARRRRTTTEGLAEVLADASPPASGASTAVGGGVSEPPAAHSSPTALDLAVAEAAKNWITEWRIPFLVRLQRAATAISPYAHGELAERGTATTHVPKQRPEQRDLPG